jgi:phage host-nuclease inhibitor protein Gam
MDELRESGEQKVMDDATKLLLDRIERDIREHKQETRDRDARLQSEFQEREKRIHDESVEREQRILAAIGDIKNEISTLKSDINQSVSAVKQDVSENTKHVQNLVRQNFWGNITTILAILGICATIGFTVWAALKSGTGK